METKVPEPPPERDSGVIKPPAAARHCGDKVLHEHHRWTTPLGGEYVCDGGMTGVRAALEAGDVERGPRFDSRLDDYAARAYEAGHAVSIERVAPGQTRLSIRDVDDVTLAVPEPATPDRRTVSLEPLTDELRAWMAAEDARIDEVLGFSDPSAGPTLAAEARVAVVYRVNGAVTGIADTDDFWAAYPRPETADPVYRLGALIGSMWSMARPIGDGPRAELLMPAPAVLAALSGQPEERRYTAAIPLCAHTVERAYMDPDNLTPGWQIRDARDETTWHDITGLVECEDDDCRVVDGPDDCVVLVSTAWSAGHGHLPGSDLVTVRIPADEAVTG